MNRDEARWATADVDVAAGMPRATMIFDRDLHPAELSEMDRDEMWLWRWDPICRTVTGIPREWP